MPYRENEGKSSSRRDDLEGLGLMMIKFLRGTRGPLFPWEIEFPVWIPVSFRDPNYFENKKLQDLDKLKWRLKAMKLKKYMTVEQLCQGVHPVM